jgi:type II secretory pathway pseudopilin PulG
LRKRFHPCKGFTLIESLTIAGILLLLVTIALPVLRNARAKASRRDCQENLTKIGRALLLYCEDNDRRIPPDTNQIIEGFIRFDGGSQHRGFAPNALVSWHRRNRTDYLWESLGNYLKTRDVLFCPSDPFAHTSDPTRRPIWWIDHHYTSYAMNCAVILRHKSDWRESGFAQNGGPKFPFAGDGEYFNPTGPNPTVVNSVRKPLFPTDSDHLGYFNTVAYDGTLRTQSVAEMAKKAESQLPLLPNETRR